MMQGSQEQMNLTDPPSEDDMIEGDLGDGMSARFVKLLSNTHRSRLRSKDSVGDVPPQMRPSKRGSEGSSASFSWTPCSAMYSAFRNELESDGVSQWRRRYSDSSAGESNEVLQRRLQEITEEVELLRTELEVTHRHLEGKHEALRILQGQAILDKATCHTKILLQKSEERTKALEKEVNALQWEITFNQVQFKNVEHEWELKYERVSSENKLLSKTLDERLQHLQELHRENSSLSQQSLELLGLLKAQERRDFQRTQPPASRGSEGSALELAVYGACQCSVVGGEPPCPCAKSAAASRRQVLHLKQELELQRRRKDEAYVMMDAFRIAFEQQLRRGSEKVLKLTESDGVVMQGSPPERGMSGTGGVTQKLRRFLPSVRDGKGLNDPKETLQRLLDLLSDKEEALAHQRKVSYMLAQNTEELQRRLQEQLTEPTMILTRGKSKPHACTEVELKSDDCSVNCKPAVNENELTSAELQHETKTEGPV